MAPGVLRVRGPPPTSPPGLDLWSACGGVGLGVVVPRVLVLLLLPLGLGLWSVRFWGWGMVVWRRGGRPACLDLRSGRLVSPPNLERATGITPGRG